MRTTLQLGKERAIVSEEKVTRWFEDFQRYVEEEVGDKELLKDPTRIHVYITRMKRESVCV